MRTLGCEHLCCQKLKFAADGKNRCVYVVQLTGTTPRWLSHVLEQTSCVVPVVPLREINVWCP